MTTEHEPWFLDLLDKSADSEQLVCEWLKRRGHDVVRPANTVAPSRDKWKDHIDDGDLLLNRDGQQHRIEVKHRPNLEFDSVEAYPWPDIIVDEKYKIDRRHEAPLLWYIILNKPRTGCFLINADSKPHWVEKTLFDTQAKRDGQFLCCPKVHLTFYQLSVANSKEKNRVCNQSNEEWLEDFSA